MEGEMSEPVIPVQMQSDTEKGLVLSHSPTSEEVSLPVTETGVAISSSTVWQTFRRWNDKVESLSGMEARGIHRVPAQERHAISTATYIDIGWIWCSLNLTANNLVVGILGPTSFQLSFLDSALCAIFATFLGSAMVGYMCLFGPRSGLRTMIIARYFMGYYPSKLCTLLVIVILLGYGMINSVVIGQILSAVAGGDMTVSVGIVVAGVMCWLITMFGMKSFHHYEKFAVIPQWIVMFVLAGSAGHRFDIHTPSVGNTRTINANRLSYFSLCLSAIVAWIPAAADYFVYYPEKSSRSKCWVSAFMGNNLAFLMVYMIGIGLGSGTHTDPTWADAFKTSSGTLILAGYEGLGGFGKVCAVLVAIGVTSNNVAACYSPPLCVQMLLGRYGRHSPRWLLTCVTVLIITGAALGGRNSLYSIFESFLPLMGYWVTYFLIIVCQEEFFFRKQRLNRARERENLENTDVGFDWRLWDDRNSLPIGWAGLAAFLIGWVGAIISMKQVDFTGPISKMVGDHGADLGIWVGSGFTLLSFPPLRLLELRMIGR